MYGGVEEGRVRSDVGIIVSECWVDWLRTWRCMNKKCVMIRLRIKGMSIMLIQVYAPTIGKDKGTKDAVYMELQGVVDKVTRGDKMVTIGTFNAWVRKYVKVWKRVIGKHGEDVESDSGRRLFRFSIEMKCDEKPL